jgi:Uma2 family endonuclease
MPVVSTAKMTARQFLVMGEDPPGVRLELVNGEVAVSPRPSLDHSFALLALSFVLMEHIRARDLGQLFTDLDTVMDELNVRCPDLLFVKKSRLSLLTAKVVEVPPDLCVELISPSTVQVDRDDKFEQYRVAGIPNYWIIDPAKRTAESYVASGPGPYTLEAQGSGSDRVRFQPFPDLEIDLSRVWRNPNP